MLSIRILVAAVILTTTDVRAAPVGNTLQALDYLAQFGYIEELPKNKASHMTEESITSAIMDFQRFAGLNETGKLDNDTVVMMNMPRCGVKDKDSHSDDARKKRYALLGSKWSKKEIIYKISTYPKSRLNKATVDKEIKKAFEVWSKHTNLKFVTDSSRRVHINIRFEKGEHGDGDAFDGPGGILAHATDPIYGGDACFDDTEQWTVNSYKGINLLQVAAHEFGHSLGLGHSDVRDALMAPFYRDYVPNFSLPKDDIKGIQALYGKKNGNDVTTKKPNQPTTKPSKPQPKPKGGDGELCSDSSIDAIFKTDNQKAYAFKGDSYWEVTDEGLADGYPRRISKDFAGLPTNIDAAFTYSGKTFFFKGNKYWRFTDKSLDSKYPKEIKKGFVGIPDNVDAAFVWSGNGKIYFFKGSKYWKYDPDKTPSVSADYPKDIAKWKGVPKNIDAAFHWKNSYTYFFKGSNYWRFNDRRFEVDSADPSFPRSTATWWFNCNSKSANILMKDSLKAGFPYDTAMDYGSDIIEYQPDFSNHPRFLRRAEGKTLFHH